MAEFPHFWGKNPETEDEYYAIHGVCGTQSFFHTTDNPNDTNTNTSRGPSSLFTRSWRPLPPPRALIFMIHGYGNDISWTMQSTAVFLASSGFACFAADLPGHGRSFGLQGFVPDLNAALLHLLSFFRSVRANPEFRGLPCFLFGESMGGALCLLLHLHLQSKLRKEEEEEEEEEDDDDDDDDSWAGAVLVAPMCKISDRIRPPWPLPQILTLLARFAPTLPVVPTTDLIEKSVKVPEKRVVAASNPRRYKGRPRLGTVVELLRVTEHLGARLSEVTLPFLVLHGSADEVTDPGVSRALYEAARSDDKTIQIYEGMLHSMLFGEPDHNINIVRSDILSWLNQRCTTPQPIHK